MSEQRFSNGEGRPGDGSHAGQYADITCLKPLYERVLQDPRQKARLIKLLALTETGDEQAFLTEFVDTLTQMIENRSRFTPETIDQVRNLLGTANTDVIAVTTRGPGNVDGIVVFHPID